MTRDPADFDIVIATRNRQAILLLSLRTMLSQSRLPRNLIVVDASERHDEVRDIVSATARELAPSLNVQTVYSQPGSAHQRNVGTARVRSPVVFYPDDDVLWFSGLAEAVMQIYSRDAEGLVGCVSASDSLAPPPGALRRPPYELGFRDRLASRPSVVGGLVSRAIIDPLHPGPTWMTTWGAKVPPAWLREEDAELCGPVTGYKMTFRTEAIRQLGGFDECMGRYALYEDADASIGCLGRWLNVRARRAKLFHYREPTARTSGREFGAMAMLNRAYVVCKHSSPGSVARGQLRRYLCFQLCRYLLQSHTGHGRERFRGALSALADARRLTAAPREELADRYLEARRSALI